MDFKSTTGVVLGRKQWQYSSNNAIRLSRGITGIVGIEKTGSQKGGEARNRKPISVNNDIRTSTEGWASNDKSQRRDACITRKRGKAWTISLRYWKTFNRRCRFEGGVTSPGSLQRRDGHQHFLCFILVHVLQLFLLSSWYRAIWKNVFKKQLTCETGYKFSVVETRERIVTTQEDGGGTLY